MDQTRVVMSDEVRKALANLVAVADEFENLGAELKDDLPDRMDAAWTESRRVLALNTGAQPVPMPHETGVGAFCHPGDDQGQRWLLVFEDAERGAATYHYESEASAAFAKAEALGWNCHLFTSAYRAPPGAQPPREPDAAMLVVVERMRPPVGSPEQLADHGYCERWRQRHRNNAIEIWRAMYDAAQPNSATPPTAQEQK